MSVSPTDEALIVALDFEGEFIVPYYAPRVPSAYLVEQVYTASSVQLRRTHFLFSSIPLFPIS